MTRPASAPAAGPVFVLLPALVLALAPIPAAALLPCEREQRDFAGPHAGARRLVAPPAAFEAWLARQREPASARAGAAEQRGRPVFLGGLCVLCHAVMIGGRRP